MNSNVFTASVINTFITMAENRMLRDIDLDYFKTRYLPGRMLELPNGQVMEAEPTTTGLTKAQFSDYVEQVLAWAINHGLTQTDEMSVLRAANDTTTQDSSLSLIAP